MPKYGTVSQVLLQLVVATGTCTYPLYHYLSKTTQLSFWQTFTIMAPPVMSLNPTIEP